MQAGILNRAYPSGLRSREDSAIPNMRSSSWAPRSRTRPDPVQQGDNWSYSWKWANRGFRQPTSPIEYIVPGVLNYGAARFLHSHGGPWTESSKNHVSPTALFLLGSSLGRLVALFSELGLVDEIARRFHQARGMREGSIELSIKLVRALDTRKPTNNDKINRGKTQMRTARQWN